MRGKEAALFGAAPATQGPLKGRRVMGGGQGQLRPGPVTHTLLSSGRVQGISRGISAATSLHRVMDKGGVLSQPSTLVSSGFQF